MSVFLLWKVAASSHQLYPGGKYQAGQNTWLPFSKEALIQVIFFQGCIHTKHGASFLQGLWKLFHGISFGNNFLYLFCFSRSIQQRRDTASTCSSKRLWGVAIPTTKFSNCSCRWWNTRWCAASGSLLPLFICSPHALLYLRVLTAPPPNKSHDFKFQWDRLYPNLYAKKVVSGGAGEDQACPAPFCVKTRSNQFEWAQTNSMFHADIMSTN